MENIIRIETISDLSKALHQPAPKHPLVAVIDFSKVDSYGEENARITSDLYCVMLKNHCHNKMKYGREYYDFQEGTLLCIAPKQVITIENQEKKEEEVVGWGLFFHPDLIRGTSLGKKIKDYTFFSYEVNEALHLSDAEKQTLRDCIVKIENEIAQNIDQHSQTLIVSNIELFLNYCSRYYDRQFITRKNSNHSILSKFEKVLSEYFGSVNIKAEGLPSVKFCADKLNLSPNYLSDLLKRETGMNAQEHIHHHIIEEAKNSLLNSNATISEIAYELGFGYPQYFSKLFKTKTGITPVEFRSLN
jgi:AraC-like DNA-binding protein